MADGPEPRDGEPDDEGWTQPVDGVLGRSWSEQQVAWEERMADLAPEERYGPGYTEPPIDWEGSEEPEAEPVRQGPPAIEQIRTDYEPADGWGSPADLAAIARARREAAVLQQMEAEFEAG